MRYGFRLLAFTGALFTLGFAGSPTWAGEAALAAKDEATTIAEKVTEEGAAKFDTFNARAMAETYREDAELFVEVHNDEGIEVKRYRGRQEIENAYAELFKNPETIKSKNHVEYAKLIAPDVLVIAGTFDLNTLKPDSPKVSFYQVRVKESGKWQISSLRAFAVLKK